MIRLLFVALAIFLFIDEGIAIKCYVCTSEHDKRCEDKNFNGDPAFMYDCSMDPNRIIPILHCRKAKYLINDKWIYVRSCNKRDNLTEAKDAEAYLCHADYCNSGVKYNTGTEIMIFSVLAAVMNFLRA
ncbi:uncharacterized protein LOC129575163 [Sitodiplosis mosellana]|uniref:uncharacterized protein LOC129575163 n=1 Tax=Sitodiplosis mosellana TaxID=263140 RepID=UPI0024446A7B|nr:uncharacterized protein LOC129575163 [Sitodiplosis mosellana]